MLSTATGRIKIVGQGCSDSWKFIRHDGHPDAGPTDEDPLFQFSPGDFLRHQNSKVRIIDGIFTEGPISMGSTPRDFKKAFSSSLSSKPPWSQANPICMPLSFKFFKDECGIGSAKSKGIGHGDLHRFSSGHIGDII